MEVINYVFETLINYHPHNTFYKKYLRWGPGDQPDDLVESKYDDLYGFPNGRKRRKIVATRLEVESGKLHHRERDYCAHHLLKLLACKRDHMPAFWNCHHYKSQLLDCRYEEWVKLPNHCLQFKSLRSNEQTTDFFFFLNRQSRAAYERVRARKAIGRTK